MQSTRASILQLIQARKGETVAGLSRELALAPATIRRHLDILRADGLLEYEEVRHGAGRPEHRFCLTDLGHEALPKDYDALLSDLVAELAMLSPDETGGRSGEEVLEFALGRIAERAAAPYAGGTVEEAAEKLRQLLAERDFAPEIEITEKGVLVTINNCPYRSVAKDNPAICSFDTGLIATVMSANARKTACIRSGDQCCAYVVTDAAAVATRR